MTTLAEMKFLDSKLQSFDINMKPAITHTQVEKLQKVRGQGESVRLNLLSHVGFG